MVVVLIIAATPIITPPSVTEGADPAWHASIERFHDCTGYAPIVVTPDGSVEFPIDRLGIDITFPYTREVAFKVLLNTCDFLDHALGPEGVPSGQVELLNVLWHQPDRVEVFKDLHERGNMPGRLYALVGLYDTSPDLFAQLARRLKKAGGTVVANHGCMHTSEPVGQIMVDVESGKLTAAFRKIGTYMKWLPKVTQ